jgi:hypothetical protein
LPGAQPFPFEAAKNRSDRSPAYSTFQLRLEDSPDAALGGAARYANRHSDHSSQRKQQRELVPCYRAGWKCSFLILKTNHRSSFVAFGRSAVFVAWHFHWTDKETLSLATGPEEAMLARFTVAPRHRVAALHGGKGRRARCGSSSPPAYHHTHAVCTKRTTATACERRSTSRVGNPIRSGRGTCR